VIALYAISAFAAIALLLVGLWVVRVQKRGHAERKAEARARLKEDARREHDELITIRPEGASGTKDGEMTWPIRVTNNGNAELRDVRLVTSFQGREIDGAYPVDIGAHEPTVFQVRIAAIYNIAAGGPDYFPDKFSLTLIARDGRRWERSARTS
jgi:hypothetical protein